MSSIQMVDPEITNLLDSIKNNSLKVIKCEMDGHALEACRLLENCVRDFHRLSMKETSIEMRSIYISLKRSYEDHGQGLRDGIYENLFYSRFVERIEMPEGSSIRAYRNLFCRYIRNVCSVHIYEPQFDEYEHYKNLNDFVKMLMKICPKLLHVRLFTRRPEPNDTMQNEAFQDLGKKCDGRKISFNHEYRSSHDHMLIMTNDGTVITCSAGLHIYKPIRSWWQRILSFFGFRRCLGATLEIYKTLPFGEHITDLDETNSLDRTAV